MPFVVLRPVAELERSVIAERARAGQRNARAKDERLGRPRVAVDASRVAVLRALGQSWASISEKLGISGKGTAKRAVLRLPKNPSAQPTTTI